MIMQKTIILFMSMRTNFYIKCHRTIKDKIERFIHDHDTIMFTICMDVIDSAFAPGVSSPSVLGLYPHSVFEISKRVILSDKVSSISIAKLTQTMMLIIVRQS